MVLMFTKCSSRRDVLSTSFSYVSKSDKIAEKWNSKSTPALLPSTLPSNLPSTLPNTLPSTSSEEDRDSASARSKSPVDYWLTDLRDTTEVESLSALQAKSVTAVSEDASEALLIRNAQVAITRVRKESAEILDGLDGLIDQLPLTIDDLRSFKSHFEQISSRLCALVQTCRRPGCDIQAENARIESFNLCQQMMNFLDDFFGRRTVNNASMESTLRKQKERLGELINATIRSDCQVIVDALHYPWGSICSKWALLALWHLTQNDAYICRIFLESRIVTTHLILMACSGCGLVRQGNYQQKAAALRVLTYLCVNREAIEQIFNEMEAGANFVNLLSWERNEIVLKEAIGLLVQITLPFIDVKKRKNDTGHESELNEEPIIKGMPLKSLVKALTNIIRNSCGRELFLLVTAALANISFLELDAFVANETSSVLVAATKRPTMNNDIALKDQVITVLANISAKHPLDIISSGGLVYLLSALQLRPAPGEIPEETSTAIERIQQKVAAALARLGTHRSCASLLVRLNGVHRLIQLCKVPHERNYSDTVLLASLAALRRISNAIGKEPFRQLGALDLIELDLCDSFVLFSSKSESYV